MVNGVYYQKLQDSLEIQAGLVGDFRRVQVAGVEGDRAGIDLSDGLSTSQMFRYGLRLVMSMGKGS
jgi:hypothetical protein